MTRQVITIAPDGIASSLQRKKGQGLDLRCLGDVAIKRATYVVWAVDHQRWFIKIEPGRTARHLRKGLGFGATLTINDYQSATGRDSPDVEHEVYKPSIPIEGRVLFFLDYEEAVKVEIEVLDALRLKGIFDAV